MIRRTTTIVMAALLALAPSALGGGQARAAAPDASPLCVDLKAPPGRTSTAGYFRGLDDKVNYNVQMELSAPTCANGVYKITTYDAITKKVLGVTQRVGNGSPTLVFLNVKLSSYPKTICIVLETSTRFLKILTRPGDRAPDTGCADFDLENGPGGRFMF